jgi:NAD(P)-dependent dehydrogenase (short-subunit alcohol dehydrogenase family)
MRKSLVAAGGLAAALAVPGLVRRLREEELRGQVALVTGGSRGLGLLLARELAREGCRVAICARDERELERAREALEARGAEALAMRCDVTDRVQVDEFVEAVTRRFGRVDVLVNNAGVIRVGPLPTLTVEDFEEALDILFWGVLNPTLAVLPQMLERKSGRIVNVTSIGGKVSVPHLVPYACGKAATIALSEGLRSELAGMGIRVITIVPGLMRTGSHLNADFKGRQEAEFTWFALGASLPLISMNAERAASQIIRAARRGDPESVLSMPAKLLTWFHGLFPGTTADVLALVARVMPEADGAGAASARGMLIQERIGSRILERVTSLGRTAARRFHQYPGPVFVAPEGASAGPRPPEEPHEHPSPELHLEGPPA